MTAKSLGSARVSSREFVWSEFADVYVELAKAGLRDEQRAPGTVRTLAYVLDRILRLAHPIVPFISDTIALQLWQRMPNTDRSPSLVIAKWPKPGTRSVALEALPICCMVSRA